MQKVGAGMAQQLTAERSRAPVSKKTGQHTSTQQSFAFCHEVFHDEPCMMPNYTHLEQLATLFMRPPLYRPRLLLLLLLFFFFFFFFFFCSKFCVGIVDCHFR